MKVLKFIIGIICRILAFIYAITVIPALFIVGVLLMTAIFLIAVVEWIFTGDTAACWAAVEWLEDDCWQFIVGICGKLSNQ